MNPLLLTLAIACQSLDVSTTYVALRSGRFVEKNPVLNHRTLIPMKVSVDVGVLWVYSKHSKRKLAATIPVGLAASGCAGGVWNSYKLSHP